MKPIEKFIFIWAQMLLMSPFLLLPILFFKDVGWWIFLLWIPLPMFFAIIYDAWVTG